MVVSRLFGPMYLEIFLFKAFPSRHSGLGDGMWDKWPRPIVDDQVHHLLVCGHGGVQGMAHHVWCGRELRVRRPRTHHSRGV